MKIVDQLKQHGFKQFNNPLKPQSHSSWQLRVRNEERVTQYFVNVNLFDYAASEYALHMPPSWKEDLVPEYEVQFNNEDGTFNANYLGRGKSVEKALQFYANMFKSMNCFDYD